MNITNYTREQIKQFVKDGICPVQALRDYDLLQGIEKEKNISKVAKASNISVRQAYRIRDKYMSGKSM